MPNPCQEENIKQDQLEKIANEVTPLVLSNLQQSGFVVTGNVQHCSDLPPATTSTNLMYRVLGGEGTPGLPTWEGGSYCPSGFYISNGVKWEYIVETFFESFQEYLNPFVFIQTSPLAVWNINHGLNKIISTVLILDNLGKQVYSDTQIVNNNTVKITFAKPFSGKAILF